MVDLGENKGLSLSLKIKTPKNMFLFIAELVSLITFWLKNSPFSTNIFQVLMVKSMPHVVAFKKYCKYIKSSIGTSITINSLIV